MSIYPPFLSKEFVEILDASKLEDKMWIEDEFIKDPGNAEKAEAWHRLQKELQSLPRPGIGRVLEHIAHAADVAGVAHVGIGTDYDGIECTADGLETVASLPSLFAAMKEEALFSEDEIAGIAGGNFLNCLDSVA